MGYTIYDELAGLDDKELKDILEFIHKVLEKRQEENENPDEEEEI